MDVSEAARVLGGQLKPGRYRRTCPTCGKAFTTNARGKFCSDICRARDQTRRNTAARRERREVETPASE